MSCTRKVLLAAIGGAVMALAFSPAAPMAFATPLGDAFTYQGRLTQSGEPVTDAVNFSFMLYDAEVGGLQIGPTLNALGFDAFDGQGMFTIDLEFGESAFDGSPRYLEVWVNGAPLAPRQPIMPAPYAIRALTQGTLPDASFTGTYSQEVALSNAGNAFTGAFTGSGAGLTSLNASNITTGTLGGSLLSGTYGNSITFNNAANAFTGTFTGSGTLLTNLNASSLAIGSVPSGRLNGTYSNALTFSNASNSFTGNGAGLTNLNAGNINGTFSSAQLPSGGDWGLDSLLNIGPGVLAVNPVNNRVGIGVTSPNVLLHVAAFNEDPLRVQINNNTRFFVSSNGGATVGGFANPPEFGLRVFGRVGLGTSDPLAWLHVARPSSSNTPQMHLEATNNGFARLRMSSADNASHWDIGVGGSDNRVDFWNSETGTLMRLQGSTQRVGIGTISPQAKLHVALPPGHENGPAVILPGLRLYHNENVNNVFTPNVAGGSPHNVVGTNPNFVVNGVTIAGGGSQVQPNQALDLFATVGGGIGNVAGGAMSTIPGGSNNEATGSFSFAAGGINNVAAGSHSFAAGRRAKANHQGSFVLADSTNADRVSNTTNRFHARFVNGYQLYTNSAGTLGVQALANATSWSSISDRYVKHNIEQVDPVDIAHRLASIPISWWNYIDDADNVQHMGPMAQDFHAAFGLGASDTHIATLDADGVALAAIQGVYMLVQEKDAEIAALNERIERLEALVRTLVHNSSN